MSVSPEKSNPFQGYTVYGPYLNTKEDRRYIQLVKTPYDRTTISYARYLMSLHLSRKLEVNEEVDHIDNDRLNDSLSNLQILSCAANRSKERGGCSLVELVCQGCNTTFTRERRQTHLIKGGKYPTSCSRKCARAVQSKGTVAKSG